MNAIHTNCAGKINLFLSEHYRILVLIFACLTLSLSMGYLVFSIRDYPNTSLLLACLIPTSIILLAGFYKLLRAHYPIEKVFIIIAFALGLIYMIVLAPIKTPDEQSHYAAAYRYSNLLLGIDWNSDNIVMRGEDANLLEYWRSDISDYSKDYSQIRETFSLLSTDSELVEKEGTVHYGFSPLTRPFWLHMQGAIGITLGRIIGLGFYPTFYLGRITSFICALLTIYAAVKITPYGKYAIIGLTLLPMTLWQIMSYSYDGAFISLSLLLGSLCIKYITTDEQLDWKRLAVIYLLMFLVTPTKIIYGLVGFLSLCIPCGSFKSNRTKVVFKAGLFFVFFASILFFNADTLLNLTSTDYVADRNVSGLLGEKEYVPSYTFSYLFSNPVRAIDLIGNTVIYQSKTHVWSFFGGDMPWIAFRGPEYMVVIFAILFTLMLLMEKPAPYTPLLRIGAFAAFVLGTIALYFSMLGWTSIDRTRIYGIQGRYFYPLMPLAFTFISGYKTSLRGKGSSVVLLALLFFNLYYSAWIFSTAVLS